MQVDFQLFKNDLLTDEFINLFSLSINRHSTDVTSGACDVRPIDHLLWPIKVEGNGVLEIGHHQINPLTIQSYVPQVVSIRDEQNWRDTWKNPTCDLQDYLLSSQVTQFLYVRQDEAYVE